MAIPILECAHFENGNPSSPRELRQTPAGAGMRIHTELKVYKNAWKCGELKLVFPPIPYPPPPILSSEKKSASSHFGLFVFIG